MRIPVKKMILAPTNTPVGLCQNLVIGKTYEQRIQIAPRLMNVIAILLIFAVVTPVYAGPRKKVDQPKEITAQVLSGEDCGKGIKNGKGKSKCDPKETGSVKKKVVKKAGTAAAVGVAGIKISPSLKD